jgi:hypothetical protein
MRKSSIAAKTRRKICGWPSTEIKALIGTRSAPANFRPTQDACAHVEGASRRDRLSCALPSSGRGGQNLRPGACLPEPAVSKVAEFALEM